MLLAIVLLAAVGAGLAALLLTRHHSGGTRPQATPSTVVVTTSAAPITPAAAKASKRKLILPVPDLVGGSLKDSVAGLRRAGFKVSLVSAPSALPRGTVVGQDPQPGAKVAKGSDVRLKISTGAAGSATTPVTTPATTPAATTTAAQQTTTAARATEPAQPATAHVPSLSGELQSAVQQLDAAGFKASVAYVPSDQPLGTVVAQTPSGEASAKTGSQVTVNVSSGRGQSSETVPSLAGKRVPQALSELHAVGLRLIVSKTRVSDRSQAGVIVLQTPLPGKHAPKNAQVLVYYGAYQG